MNIGDSVCLHLPTNVLLRLPSRTWLWAKRISFVLSLLMSSWALPTLAQTTPMAPAPLLAQASDALPQAPSHLNSTTNANAPSLRQLPIVELNAQTNKITLLPYTEYWIDDSTDTTLDALVARASAGKELFKPSTAQDRHTVHGKVLWLRFETRITDPRSHWLLQLDAPLIDSVELYWRDTQQQWILLKAGDVVPRLAWPMKTRLPTFSLKNNQSTSTVYYMRIENQRIPVSLPMQIYRDTDFVAAQQNHSLLLGAMLGLVALVLSVSIFMTVVMRDRAFAAYVVYVLALGMFMMTNVGLSAQYLWPDSPMLADRMNYVLACLTAALGPWFVHSILQPVIQRQFWALCTGLLTISMLICAAVEWLMPNMLSYQTMNIGTLLAVLTVYGLVAATWQRGEALSRWIALCFAPVAISALPLIMRNLGLIPNAWYTQYGVLLAASIEMPLLLYALLVRSIRRRESRARMAGLPKHDALTGLPNTRSLLEQLHGSITRANRFGHHYGLILVDLTNHNWFLKEHGQEMADRALILAATRLQMTVRDVDSVCHLERAQFVILVEGHCSAALLSKIAARIAASGHKPTDILPVGASLKLVITCALMPSAESREAGEEANAQLGWLIATAENMPLEGRKTLRTIGF